MLRPYFRVIIRPIDLLFLQGLALGITAAASPGPFQAFLINQTLTSGFRRSAVIALAPLIADIPIVITIFILLDQLPLGPRIVRLLTLASILILVVFG